MAELGRELTVAILIDVSDEEVVRRLGGRRTCVKKGHVFHVDFDPPKNEGVCDIDGSRADVRDDDKPEVIRNRLEQYHEKTEPLVEYYERRSVLRRVDGAAPPDEVTEVLRRTARDDAPGGGRGRLAARASLNRMIVRKTPEQIDQMAAAGEILVRCLRMLRAKVRPGVTTAELDAAAEKFIRSQGALPAFKGYRGFPGSICASPNSMVVHGIPGPYELKRGDMISIDVGVVKTAGWPTRQSPSRSARSAPSAEQLLDGDPRGALRRGRAGTSRQPSRRRLERHPADGRVRGAVDDPHPRRPRHRPRHARGAAGAELRRAGQGPGARGGHGARDRADGQRRRPAVRMGDDSWSVYSEDGSLAAHFEFTVAVTADGPRILTPWHEHL